MCENVKGVKSAVFYSLSAVSLIPFEACCCRPLFLYANKNKILAVEIRVKHFHDLRWVWLDEMIELRELDSGVNLMPRTTRLGLG